jgi:hypothetical protein
MKFKLTIHILIVLLSFSSRCNAVDVVFLDLSNKPSVAWQKVHFACQYYGLDVKRFIVGKDKDSRWLTDSASREKARAVIMTEKVLEALKVKPLIASLKQENGKGIPLMILEITPQTSSHFLSEWSSKAVVGCVISTNSLGKGYYRVWNVKDITKELSGVKVPIINDRVSYFVLDKVRSVDKIIDIKDINDDIALPIFIRTMLNGQEVFFQSQIQFSESSVESIWRFNRDRFFEIAPLFMFLRFACGDRCWHSVGQYANLTIDDPWLTEPYGNLSFKGLLEEMEKMNFHTTIAFIPWNYDRSERDTMSLFRDHPDRFSVCIHGNNHDHREFYKYKTNVNDPWPAKPLTTQEANITQSIARMEEFKRLTGLAYDRVMVFPHGISPARTLGILKKYNFLATSNAGNVPLGSKKPLDPLFYLRPVTLAFENFTSLNRYLWKENSQADIAVELFLGNPILLYGHHDIFQEGIDSFNEVAEMINHIEPNVKWQSLGDITRHLYLQRRREDGNYDILAFCRRIELKNKHMRDKIYFVRKEETFSPPIKQVSVDDKPYTYKRSDSDLSLAITIPAGESRIIDIEYENNLDLASVAISKNDPRINLLRKMSDFRDITLSQNIFGQTFIRIYYETGLYKLGMKRLSILLLLLALFISCSAWYVRKRYIMHHR